MSSLVDTIVAETGYPRCVVSVLVGFSFPLRSALIAFCNKYRAALLAKKAEVVGFVTKNDVVSKELGLAIVAGRAALAPINTLLATLPLAQMAESCPTIVDQIKTVTDHVNLTIPNNIITSAADIAGFDVFAGTTDYKSIQKKVNQLAFKLARATSIAVRANNISTDIDRALEIVDMYIDIFSRSQ